MARPCRCRTHIRHPTALEKTGDFSQSLNSNGTLRVIYDPLNLVSGARQPFPGNVIPSSRLNPTGLAIAANYQPALTAPAYYGANDLNAPGRLPCRAAQYTGKIDEDFASWWRASLSYLRYFSLEPGNTEFPTRFESRPMAPAAPGGFHSVEQPVHRQPDHRDHGPLRVQSLPQLQLRREPGLRPEQSEFQPRAGQPGSQSAVPVPRRRRRATCINWASPTTIRSTCTPPTTSPPTCRSTWAGTA